MSRTATSRRALARLARLVLTASVGGRAGRGPRALAYHSIDETRSLQSVSPAALRAQLAALRAAGWRSLSLGEFIKQILGPPDRRQGVLITFDDGYENFYTHAAPLLDAYGFRATVFVVTDDVGGTPGWFTRDRQPIERLLDGFAFSRAERERWRHQMSDLANTRLLSWDQARELRGAGFDIQSHSASHHFLTHLDDDALRADLQRSQLTLEDRLGVRADALCYPYGITSDRVIAMGREQGFCAAFLSEDTGIARDPFRLGRIGVGATTTPGDLRFALSPAIELALRLRRGLRALRPAGRARRDQPDGHDLHAPPPRRLGR